MHKDQRIARRIETCRHYGGFREPRCAAGMTVPSAKIPCVRLLCADPPGVQERLAQCPKLELRTREEVEQEIREGDEAVAKVMRVMAVVRPWRSWTREKPEGKTDVIECPECKGKLHLSQSAYNGHVHGKCETADCVAWME